MQDHVCCGTRSPAEARSLAILYFLTPCRSKVTIIRIRWYADPLHLQDHICFPNSLQKQSHNLHLFFDSLQKQSHIYLNLLICWLTAKARSHLFWHLIHCRSKVLAILYLLDPLQKQGLDHSLITCLCAEGLKVATTLHFSACDGMWPSRRGQGLNRIFTKLHFTFNSHRYPNKISVSIFT